MGTVILTQFTLLVPTFSLPFAPPLLPVWLHRHYDAPLPLPLRAIRSFGSMLEPRYIFGAASLD